MSFLGSHSDAMSIIHSVEMSNDIGNSKGKPSSKVLKGESGPGVSNAAASGELTTRRTKLKAGNSGLTRKK